MKKFLKKLVVGAAATTMAVSGLAVASFAADSAPTYGMTGSGSFDYVQYIKDTNGITEGTVSAALAEKALTATTLRLYMEATNGFQEGTNEDGTPNGEPLVKYTDDDGVAAVDGWGGGVYYSAFSVGWWTTASFGNGGQTANAKYLEDGSVVVDVDLASFDNAEAGVDAFVAADITGTPGVNADTGEEEMQNVKAEFGIQQWWGGADVSVSRYVMLDADGKIVADTKIADAEFATVAVDKDTVSIDVAKDGPATVTATPDTSAYADFVAIDKTVTWTTSNDKVATVDNGVITGVAPGTAVVTASLANGAKAEVSVTITDSAHYHSIYKVAAKNATFKKDGMKAHYACKGCETLFSDAKGTKVVTKEALTISKIATVTFTDPAAAVNGNAKNVKVKVVDANGKKVATKYYTVTYKNKLTGKTVKATNIKNAGKYIVTVTFKTLYAGSKSHSFDVVPGKASVKLTSKTAKKVAIAVTAGKGSNYTVVRYSTSAKFASKVTKTVTKKATVKNVNVTKLTSGKTLYVKVRSLKTIKVGTKITKIWGAWSAVKSVKIK